MPPRIPDFADDREPAMRDRKASSPAVLCERVRQVLEAWRARDEHAYLMELNLLEHEAAILRKGCQGFSDRRMTIALERDATAKAGY
jgi:hypothetical protein